METSMVCPGCGLRIEPIYVFDRSPKTRKPYLITKCPRERCGFNIDIEDYVGQRKKRSEDNKREDGGENGRRPGWRFGL